MAQVQPVVRIELDPLNPVPEICAVIMAITPYHLGQEDAILRGVQEAIQVRRDQLKGAETSAEQIRKPDTDKKDQ